MSRNINDTPYRVMDFEYAAKLALDAAALVHRNNGLMCQCRHLAHAGRCTERNADPLNTLHVFCRCAQTKLMGEASTCAMPRCSNPTRVINGIATITCERCWEKREAFIRRGLETFDAKRRARGRR